MTGGVGVVLVEERSGWGSVDDGFFADPRWPEEEEEADEEAAGPGTVFALTVLPRPTPTPPQPPRPEPELPTPPPRPLDVELRCSRSLYIRFADRHAMKSW